MDTLTNDEKQLISSLNWFRSRYALFQGLDPNRKATKEAIEAFGISWIGQFKLDWSHTFDSLVSKKILNYVNAEYTFSDYGKEVKDQSEAETPFFKYEYDNYFTLEAKSKAHSKFCQKVYGADFSQHGLINQKELNLFIERLKTQQSNRVLDLGCGNGRITEYVSAASDVAFFGIDISTEGINKAKLRNQNNLKLQFEVGNMNALVFPNHSFDAIISMDTLYYANNLEQIIKDLLRILTPDGVIYAYFSQWIMDVSYSENLKGDQTHLAKILRSLGLKYDFTDLTHSGLAHWKLKLQILEEMQPEFVEEGHFKLWDYRYREAVRYANWGDAKYARYFYEIKK